MATEQEIFGDILPEDYDKFITYNEACMGYIKKFLFANFKEHYPGIEEWFETKVRPGLETGERSIYTMMFNCHIVGILIVKHGKNKNKICSFFLLPYARRIGFGKLLFTFGVGKLRDKDIIITVPEKRMEELYSDSVLETRHKTFVTFLDLFNFKQVAVIPHLYNEHDEYIFIRKKEMVISD